MNKKNIIFVSSSISFFENFLFETIHELSKKNNIKIITNTKFQTLNFSKEIDVIHLPITRKFNPFIDFYCFLQLQLQLKKNKFNLLISSSPKGGLLTSLVSLFFLFKKYKRIHIVTGQIWYDKTGLVRNFLKAIDKFIFYKCNLILADSLSQIKFLTNEGFANYPIKLIANGSMKGVDTKDFFKDDNLRSLNRKNLNIKNSEFVILFLGRINKQKGILLLLDVFARLLRNGIEVKLLIVGRDEENLVNYIKTNYFEFHNNIIIKNYTNNIKDIYSCSDLLCLPSSREGFGMTVIEANSFELPVIASDVVGIKDSVINNETGLLFDAGSNNQFYECIKLLYYDKGLRLKLGSNGRKRVIKYFNRDDVILKLSNIINELL